MEAILEAAARVLVDEGFEAATTNRIAFVAGVSIGSLYQYFPGKEALVRALLEQHLACAAAMRPPELDLPDLTLRRAVSIAVRWQLSAHAANPRLHQVLTATAPQILGTAAVRAFEREYQRVLCGVLLRYRHELVRPDLDLAAFVMAQCMESLTHGAVVHHPELLDREELANEITDLLVGYLTGR